MGEERTIIGAAIVAGGIATAVTTYQGTFTPRILVGTAGVAVLLSLIAATGAGPAKFASAMAMLVATTAVLYYAIPFLGFFGASPSSPEPHYQQ